MTKLSKQLVALAGALVLSAAQAHAVTVSFSNVEDAVIQFNGDSTFNFNPDQPTGNDFKITSGTAGGLEGDITGTYTIGSVTTVSGLSTASVSGTGTITIFDGATPFSANVQWVDIAQFGTGSTLNTQGSVNLSSIVYAGSNADLLALASGNPSAVITFQFTPAVSLSTLKTTSQSTSFSGTIATTVPDGGLTAMFLGLGFLGVAGLRRKLS